MNSKSITTGLLCLCLTACANLSTKQPSTSVQQNLVQPCPAFLAWLIVTNNDLVRNYLAALSWGQDCREKHNALVQGSK